MHMYFPILLLALFLIATPSFANEAPCYNKFYSDKSATCVAVIAKDLAQLPVDPADPYMKNHSNVQAMVGLLAEIFKGFPKYKEYFLRQPASIATKGIYLEALYRADLKEEAVAYAEANKLTGFIQAYQMGNLPSLPQVQPADRPSDNDLMVGAYMGSGKAEYIQRILDNFSSSDDNMAYVAFRMGLMIEKFGGAGIAPGRDKTMVLAICEMYQCKKDPRNMMRIMTMAAGFWTARSLANGDEKIKRVLNKFFENDLRLKKIMVSEQNAFSNYATNLLAFRITQQNQLVNKSLMAYERLATSEQLNDIIRQQIK